MVPIAICGVTCQRSPVAWPAMTPAGPKDVAAAIRQYEMDRLFMSRPLLFG